MAKLTPPQGVYDNYEAVPETVRKLKKANLKTEVEKFGEEWYVVEIKTKSLFDGFEYVVESLELTVKVGGKILGMRQREGMPPSRDGWIEESIESILSQLMGQIENVLYTY